MLMNNEAWKPDGFEDRHPAWISIWALQLCQSMAIFIPFVIILCAWLGTHNPFVTASGALLFSSSLCLNMGYLAGMGQERLGWTRYFLKIRNPEYRSRLERAEEVLRAIAIQDSHEAPGLAQAYLDFANANPIKSPEIPEEEKRGPGRRRT